MLVKVWLDWIEEKLDAIEENDKLWAVKAFLLGGLKGIIDFFEAFGIFIWVICVFAAFFGKKDNEEAEAE